MNVPLTAPGKTIDVEPSFHARFVVWPVVHAARGYERGPIVLLVDRVDTLKRRHART